MGVTNLPNPIFTYFPVLFLKVTITNSVNAYVDVWLSSTKKHWIALFIALVYLGLWLNFLSQWEDNTLLFFSFHNMNIVQKSGLFSVFHKTKKHDTNLPLCFDAYNTHLCSLELCQTMCHWPDTGVWASQLGNSLPYKNIQWSGRRLCHPRGKYGHEQVYLGSHIVPLHYKEEKRGGEGQRCKIVMDFLFSISVIHNLRVGSPHGGCKMTSEGLKVIKGLWKIYSSHIMWIKIFIHETIAVVLFTWCIFVDFWLFAWLVLRWNSLKWANRNHWLVSQLPIMCAPHIRGWEKALFFF